jgi:ribonuclease T
MKEIFISVDIEAAGPFAPTYSMLSLGAAVVENPQLTFYAEIKPVSEKSLPDAMKVVGRTLKDFARVGQDPKDAMIAFRDWLQKVAKDRKPVFVGFNATFDWAFVNFYFHEYLSENPFGFGGLDIKSYYMGMTGCSWEDTRSSQIAKEFKGPSPHTHQALDDALEQGEMFRKMQKKASR